MSEQLGAMPAGMNLQVCDDCGVPERQPHVRCEGVHQYGAGEVKGDERAHNVAWGWRAVRAVYDDLRPDLEYVLAITYANEAYNHRVQSLWAGHLQIHGPHPLPRGGAERLLFRLPRELTRTGHLELEFRLEAEVNVVVSVIELWAAAPAPRFLHLDPMTALMGDLGGRALDLAWEPVPGAEVSLCTSAGRVLAGAQSGADGAFSFPRALFEGRKPPTDLEVVARHAGAEARRIVKAADLSFEPLRYRPLPTAEGGLGRAILSLDGVWQLDPAPGAGAAAPGAHDWKPLRVPGQFRQQGYDVPPDRTVLLARGFDLPAAWHGRRIFLRFDAIHSGAEYFLNGRPVGESQNLFTPVELDITAAARPGERNRLVLEMNANTLSERLSYSSGYAFHNLAGIDRSVRVFALPPVHIRHLRTDAGLDADLRDGKLRAQVELENATGATQEGLRLDLRLWDPEGRPVEGAARQVAVGPLEPGRRTVALEATVPAVQQWNAEKPRLYRATLSLREGPRLLERVQRRVGFRTLQVRGSQVYLNGRPLKLAGACHHETDPVTGRADTGRHAAEDVRLMKGASLNYIRTSHYPPTPELLEVADRLGMYVEVEAPFCWVGDDRDMSHLRAVLEPTSAMVDEASAHPCVIIYSLANESEFNPLFEQSARLCRQLDPTRPLTFNNPDPRRICHVANLHYAGMPFDQNLPGDPRPIFMGEYFFPVCHDQTDVRMDPGLRELWGAGHSDPTSAWGRDCAASYGQPYMQPGEPPGAWSSLVASQRFIGGAIWAALDDAFYFPDGTHVGYAWVHGFWGLIDAWRRPKPEWWLSKLIFSPVWFPVRHVDARPADGILRLPVENRYSFTDLGELQFTWECGGQRGTASLTAAPGRTGELALPWPEDAGPGEELLVRVTNRRGDLITLAGIRLGPRAPQPPPAPAAGAPAVQREGNLALITGDRFCLVVDLKTGELRPDDPRYHAALRSLPALHLTRFDFGDMVPGAPPYAVLPDAATRVPESAAVTLREGAVEVTVRDRYADFAGLTRWLLDRAGTGRVSVDYEYTGEGLAAREVGVRFLLGPQAQRLTWRRWSEWAAYPADNISRTEGVAAAHRDPALGPADDRTPPRWPWSLDETELGTADFRSVKLNIYQASLTGPDGAGLRALADADRHVRACLDPAGVRFHVLSQCRLAPVRLARGQHVTGEYAVQLLAP